MNTEEIFSRLEDALDNKYYDKKTFRLLKKTYKKLFDKKTKKKSDKIIIPFYGYVNNNTCFGIQKNYNLYTQCTRKKSGSDYCIVCEKQCQKYNSNKPLYGDIRDRKNEWSEELNWKPKGCSREIPFIEVVDKLQLDLNKIKKKVKELGWRDIPECHLKKIEKKKKKKKKTQYHLCSSDEE